MYKFSFEAVIFDPDGAITKTVILMSYWLKMVWKYIKALSKLYMN